MYILYSFVTGLDALAGEPSRSALLVRRREEDRLLHMLQANMHVEMHITQWNFALCTPVCLCVFVCLQDKQQLEMEDLTS